MSISENSKNAFLKATAGLSFHKMSDDEDRQSTEKLHERRADLMASPHLHKPGAEFHHRD